MRLGAGVVLAFGLTACVTAAPPEPRASGAYADYLIGRIANSRADHPSAADRYFSALQRAPRDQALLDGALRASLAAGDIERARQAARMSPRTGAPAFAHVIRANDAILALRWPQANAELEAVEGTAAEELLSRILVVWTRAGQGRAQDVVADLSPLASIRPYGALFAYQQAMVLEHAGRDEEALAAYALGAEGGLWLPAAVERHADSLVRTGRRDEAIALLSREQNRSNPALAAALTRVQAGQRASLTPITTSRGAALGLYGLSAIFSQEYDRTNAAAALTLALMLDPEFDGARITLAQHQIDLGNGARARTLLNEIAPTSSYAGAARTLESWMLLDAGDTEGALALARANAETGGPRAQRTLADIYRRLRRFDEAEAIYTQLIAAQPQDWRLHFARGAARERLNRWPEAEADLQRALVLSPEQPDVMNYLGYVWVDRGERLSEGLALIQRAVELRPNSGAIIDSLGWAYYRMGEYARAVDYLERAVELEPADSTLNDHLGDAYWRLGRRIEARFQWERAASMAMDEAAASIRAKIEAGLPPEPDRQSATR